MTSILIVRLGALGDVIHAMPVVPALIERWPEARIDWLVDPRYVDVVRLVTGLRRAVPFDPRGLVAGAGGADALGTLAELRRAHYDVAFDLQGLVKSAAAARLAGAAETVGFSRDHLREPAARFFYSRTVDVPEGVHVIRKNLALVSAEGMADAELRFALTLSPSAMVDDVAGRVGHDGYVVLNPGAAWPNKRWPPARFGELAAAIRTAHGLPSLVVWGPDEEALGGEVVRASGGAAVLAPATGIVDLFGLMRAARLVVSGDTGPLHIAAAVGTPVVGLFGPTSAERNGPWAPDDISVSRTAACECHYERRCRRVSACIEDIDVDEVARAVSDRLAPSRPRVRT